MIKLTCGLNAYLDLVCARSNIQSILLLIVKIVNGSAPLDDKTYDKATLLTCPKSKVFRYAD